jgi:hypothetical protein
MRSQRFNDALEKLAAAEDEFLKSVFLAPVVRGGEVRVKIAGVVCKLRVEPVNFEGWGVFCPMSHTSAELFAEASLTERRRYLELFPMVRLILARRYRNAWLAVPAHRGDQRIQIDGLVPVYLASDVQAFEVVRTRFDGVNFWFEGVDPAYDPAAAAYLRQRLQEATDVNQLDRPGLTPEQNDAYAVNFAPLPKRDRRKTKEPAEAPEPLEQPDQKLRDALHHAGARLVDYLERGDSYRVTFRVGGRQHVTSVEKDDLTVQTAGICLSGQDRNFDLASLVGVLREAQGAGGVVPVGEDNGGMQEEWYWRVHPPRNR